jgi:putative endopeptidase
MTSTMEPVRGVHPDNMDTTVQPSADFYRFANGRWLDQNPIPAEYSRWGAFEQLHELSQAQLRAILDEAGSLAAAGGRGDAPAPAAAAGDGNAHLEDEAVHRALVGTLYATGMDEGACEGAGFAPLRDVFDAIDACEDASALVALIATLAAQHGVDAGFFGVDASPDAKRSDWVVLHLGQHGILGIGDRDFYLDGDKRHIRDQYRDHVARMLRLAAGSISAGDDAFGAAADALLDLETRIAQNCMTKTEHRDPHKTYNKFDSVAALADSTDTAATIPWGAFFKGLGLGTDFGGIVVDNVALVKALGELLQTVPLDSWKSYVRFHATSSIAPYLGKDAEEEHFNFHVKVMTGQPQMKPRWKRVITHVGSHLEESLAILYVARYFSPQAKKACKEMVDILVDVVRTRIDEVEWMSADTKKRAHAKLTRFRAKIGYPDKWYVAPGFEGR